VFAYTLANLGEDLSYKIEYESVESNAYSLKIFELPRLEQADAAIDYPDYTRIDDRLIEDTLTISAVEGSNIDYSFNFNKALASAVLIPETGPEIPLEPNNPENTQFSVRFRLENSLSYELVLRDREGRSNAFPPKVRLSAILNEAPELSILFPKGDQRVSPIEEFDLIGNATDDFGLIDYGVGIALGTEEPGTLSLKNGDDRQFEANFSTRLMLEEHDLEPGSLISWYVWADDIGPDGEPRRTTSSIFFSETRSLDEIFRENQSGGGQQPQSGAGDEAIELLDRQREISIAIWNLKQRGPLHGSFVEDAEALRDAQAALKAELNRVLSEVREPERRQHGEQAGEFMDEAVQNLDTVASNGDDAELPSAWKNAQGSYQELLRLAPNESNVSRSQNGQGGGSNRRQGQLNNLEFSEDENRYETESQAQAETTEQQREQLETLSKLSELARRQQDINQRLQELQTALEAASNEDEKEKVRRELKRLEEEQRQMLSDIDQARERMDRQSQSQANQESRQQLDQARENMQRSQEQLEQGQVSQALAAGNRAKENLEELKEEFRERTSSQFSEQMRDAREAARELIERQKEIDRQLDQLQEDDSPRMDTSDERGEVVDAIEKQEEKFEELLNTIRRISEDAEATEPRLHRQLYDAMREQNQFETATNLSLGARLLNQGFVQESQDRIAGAERDIERLAEEIESAAESVLGNEEAALRFATAELDELTKQLQEGQPQENGSAQNSGSEQSESQSNGEPNQQANSNPSPPGQGSNSQSSPSNSEQASSQGQTASNTGSPSPQSSPASSSGGGSGGPSLDTSADSPTGLAGLDELIRQMEARGNPQTADPLTGQGFSDWAERLRTVEELIESESARERLAQAREIAEEIRRDYKRRGSPPQWSLVEQGIAAPLTEVRGWLRQEILRLEEPDTLQPIDRDPVPQAFQESVRKYYESLGE